MTFIAEAIRPFFFYVSINYNIDKIFCCGAQNNDLWLGDMNEVKFFDECGMSDCIPDDILFITKSFPSSKFCIFSVLFWFPFL